MPPTDSCSTTTEAAPGSTLPERVESARRVSGAAGSLRRNFVSHLETRGTHSRWVLWAALAGMFATTFPITILTLSLGSIASEFETSETTMAWVISAPMLLSAVALPLLGKLGDLYGHRRIFLAGFLGATLVAGLTALAWGPLSLIGLRTLAAVLGGATQPTSMALIFSVYRPEERVRAMGWWSMTGAAAPALGLIAGGPLVDFFGWRTVFVLQAVLSAVALVLAGFVLKETERLRVRFDLLGAATLAVGVAGFMFVLSQAGELGVFSPIILISAAVGAFAIWAFIRVERRVEEPLLPLEFFRQRNFSAAIVSNAFMAAAYMGAFVLAPFVLLRLFGFSISMAAGIMLLRTLTLTLCSPLGGNLGFKIGERGASLVGASIMTVSLGLMAVATHEEFLLGVGLALVLQGMGHGLALPSLTSAIANCVPERDLGVASAANRLTSQAGAAFGITLLTLVYGYGGVDISNADTSAALTSAFLAGAGLSALSFGSALWMQKASSG